MRKRCVENTPSSPSPICATSFPAPLDDMKSGVASAPNPLFEEMHSPWLLGPFGELLQGKVKSSPPVAAFQYRLRSAVAFDQPVSAADI